MKRNLFVHVLAATCGGVYGLKKFAEKGEQDKVKINYSILLCGYNINLWYFGINFSI